MIMLAGDLQNCSARTDAPSEPYECIDDFFQLPALLLKEDGWLKLRLEL